MSSTPPLLISEPRWATPRHPARPTRGGLDAQVAALLGWSFFPWQVAAADVAGEYDPATKIPAYRSVGVGVARQNGKTTLICSRIARQLIAPRQTVAYTAQDRGLARTKWAEHVELLMSTPFAERVARVDRTNHREMLVMDNGSRYMPVTPSAKKAARSLSVDLAVIDEAHSHEDMGVVSAIQPAMAARPHAQIWLLSNAGTMRSALWRHYSDLGRLEAINPASTVCWIEYAAAGLEVDIFDRDAWAAANPSMGYPGGVLETALADGALTMDRDTFLREHLNVWADPAGTVGIDAIVWAACRSDLTPDTNFALGLDFTPERDRGALVIAGRPNGPDGPDLDGPIALEVLESSSDLEQIVTRAAEVANRWNAFITIDRGSPASSAIPALERATVSEDGLTHKVWLVPLTDLVRACGGLHDAALRAQVTHRGDYRLTDAVTSATKRQVGDAWAWKRRGHADISPLVAATLARWGVVAAPEILIPAVY